ncbi:MAG: patatin-like phospholipase family protein [bacterium]
MLHPLFQEKTRNYLAVLPHKEIKRPKVALVLSGGGSRGIASIGVMKALEEANIPVDLIVGTSIGSIIGGLYASGYSVAELEQLVDTTNWSEVLSFTNEARRSELLFDAKAAADRSILTVRIDDLERILPKSVSFGQRMLNYLNLLTLNALYHPNPSFDDLKIPFRTVATDLVSGQRVVLDRGDLTQALRASTSVPLVYSPVSRDTVLLLDGGIISNIPADVARNWGADIVIAVDVTSPLRTRQMLNDIVDYADQIIGISMRLANKEQLSYSDIVIRPELGSHLPEDFGGIDSMVTQGYLSTLTEIPRLKSLLETKRKEMYKNAIQDTTFGNAQLIFDSTVVHPRWHKTLSTLQQRSQFSRRELVALLDELSELGDYENCDIHIHQHLQQTAVELHLVPYNVLRSIELFGSERLSPDSLKPMFSHLVERGFNPVQTREALEAILKMYRRHGYSLARISMIRFDPSTGTLSITIDEGKIYRRDIIGTVRTKDYILWRELPWEEGEAFQLSKAAAGLSNAYGTNLFEQIHLEPKREGTAGEHQIIVIHARERNTALLRLGVLIDNERGLQSSIDIREQNLLGIGAEVGVLFWGGNRNRSLEGEFKISRLFNSYLTLSAKGFYTFRDTYLYGDEPLMNSKRWNRIQVGEFRELREGGSLSFGSQLERLGTVTIEGRLETHRVWNISSNVLIPESYKIASLKLGTKLDDRDRFPFPHRGVVMDFVYESAIFPLRSGVGFTKMSFTYDIYQTYFGRHTLHPHIQFGFADETLPITEQFSIGGRNNFFGLREDNARGRQIFIASLEYRYESPWKIFFDTYLRARYDIGSIWLVPDEIRLKDLRHGIGIAIALDTPIGLAEFAVGRSFFFRKELLNNPLSLGPAVAYFVLGYEF